MTERKAIYTTGELSQQGNIYRQGQHAFLSILKIIEGVDAFLQGANHFMYKKLKVFSAEFYIFCGIS
jgi:hypothetical protein